MAETTFNKDAFIIGITDKYNQKLIENREMIEANVIGCLFQDVELIDECGLTAKDFIVKQGRDLYKFITFLRKQNYKELDADVYYSLSQQTIDTMDSKFGGWDKIQLLKETVSLKNWDAFLVSLKRSNIELRLADIGFDLLTPRQFGNYNIIPFDFFERENLSPSEIEEWYEKNLLDISTDNSKEGIVEEGFIDFDDDFIAQLESKEEVGVSFAEAGVDANGNEIRTFPFMSNNLLGLKHGTLNCWAAHSGCGKTTYMVTVAMSLIAHGEKIIVVTNESRLNDLKTQFLIWVLTRCLGYYGLSKKKLISSEYTADDREMIRKARLYWKEHYEQSIKVVVLSDANSTLTCQEIKKNIIKHGCTTFLVDTFKLDVSDTSNGDSFWLSLIKDVRELTKIAMKYDVIGLMTLQLALNSLNRLWIDSNCLSQSKAIKETLSNLIMFRKVTDAELDPESPIYLHPFRSKQQEDGTWKEEPYEPDRTKVWRCFFIDKSRRGADSNDTGVAYLCRYDGDHCCFYETAKCRPTHKLINT